MGLNGMEEYVRKKSIILLFLVFILSLFSSIDPQERLRCKQISLDDGLSQSTIFSMTQDHKGFLWIATETGLNRYDGYNFKIYLQEPEKPDSLSNSYVWSLLSDSHETLWAGTDNGLSRYNEDLDNFEHFFYDEKIPTSISNNRVFVLYEDRAGTLWLGTDGGLNHLDPVSNAFTRYQFDANNPDSLSHDHVRAILQDHDGFLWVGTEGGGLNRLNIQAGTFERFHHSGSGLNSISDDVVLALCEDNQGNLWVGTRNGLDRFDSGRNRIRHFTHVPGDTESLSDNHVNCIFQDSSGIIWIGTNDGGVNIYNQKNDSFSSFRNDPDDPVSLAGDRVLSILEDRSGNIWFGSYTSGLSRFNQNSNLFKHYKSERNNPNSLSNNLVRQIFKDEEGILWVATDGGGLNRIDRKTGKVTVYTHDPADPTSIGSNLVFSIFMDSDGIMWVTTNGGGLNRFDRKKGTFDRFINDPDDPESLSHDFVRTIREDKRGYLWLGTADGGLNRFDKKTGKCKRFLPEENNPNTLSYHRIYSLFYDRTGILWVGTYGGGLNRFNPETEENKIYRFDEEKTDGIRDDYILSIYEDSRGILWLGTAYGLVHFDRDNERFSHYIERDGLPDRVVYAIVEDNHGNLWLSTNRGLSRFNPESGKFKNFDVHDGLQSHEFNTYSYHKADDGELFFGGINGFNSFYPDEITRNQTIPPVVITRFNLFNREVPIRSELGGRVVLDRSIENTKAITLSYRQNVFSFEFAALHFTAPEKNQYTYMMEGLDSDWNQVGNRRFVSYAGIPPGKYTFRVKGSNSDEIWNEYGVAIKITVVPPFWKTRWFITLAILFGIGGIFLVAFWRVRALTKKKTELEKIVALRTEELKEISLKDPLTGLRNRRFIHDVLLEDLEAFIKQKCHILENRKNRRGPIENQVYGVLIIDIDHFKTINDKHGHDVGDKWLVEFSRIMRQSTRADDEVIRYGGEEFLVILKNTAPDFMNAFTAKLKGALDRIDHELKNPELRRTCSIGFTQFPFFEETPRTLSFEQVVRLADLALYHAKNNGRDMTVQVLPGNRLPEIADIEHMLESLEFGIKHEFYGILTSR